LRCSDLPCSRFLLVNFCTLGWFDGGFGGDRRQRIGLLRPTMLEKKFLEQNRIDRLFENHTLESFKTASFNNMIFVIVEGRHQYNGKIGRFLLYRLIQFIAVHIRHNDVAQDGIKNLPAQPLHGENPRCRSLNVTSFLFQKIFERLTDPCIVIDHQNSQAAQRITSIRLRALRAIFCALYMKIRHHPTIEVFPGTVFSLVGHLPDATRNVLDLFYLRGDALEPFGFNDIVLVRRDPSHIFLQHLDLVDEYFQRIVDFVRQSVGKFTERGELVSSPELAYIFGKPDGAGFVARVVVDYRGRDRDRDPLSFLGFKSGFKITYPAFTFGLIGPHRCHHLARFVETGINLQDFLPQDLFRRKTKILSGTVVVEYNGSSLIDRDDDV